MDDEGGEVALSIGPVDAIGIDVKLRLGRLSSVTAAEHSVAAADRVNAVGSGKDAAAADDDQQGRSFETEGGILLMNIRSLAVAAKVT